MVARANTLRTIFILACVTDIVHVAVVPHAQIGMLMMSLAWLAMLSNNHL